MSGSESGRGGSGGGWTAPRRRSHHDRDVLDWRPRGPRYRSRRGLAIAGTQVMMRRFGILIVSFVLAAAGSGIGVGLGWWLADERTVERTKIEYRERPHQERCDEMWREFAASRTDMIARIQLHHMRAEGCG